MAQGTNNKVVVISGASFIIGNALVVQGDVIGLARTNLFRWRHFICCHSTARLLFFR